MRAVNIRYVQTSAHLAGIGLQPSGATRVLVVMMYSYAAGGDPLWYIASGPMTNVGSGVAATGTLDKYRGGQCASCMYQMPTTMGNDGDITITLTSPTAATVQLPNGRMTQIQPEAW